MNYSIRATIAGVVAPRHRLSFSSAVWASLSAELTRRSAGNHESGAFLLGARHRGRSRVMSALYYDDLDPRAYETGIVSIDGAYYGDLWRLCREKGLHVVADIHCHPGLAEQSPTDAHNPMVMQAG